MNKRILSFLMTLMLLLSVFYPKSVAYAASYAAQRDTVLVVDISASMFSKPLNTVKASIKKFYENNMNDRGDNRISIVAYSNEVKYYLELIEVNTQNKAKVYAFLDKLSHDSSTNMYSGLLKAHEILKKDTRTAAAKNIILLTDGIPNAGITTEEVEYTDRYKKYLLSIYNEHHQSFADNKSLPKLAGGLYKFFNENLKDNYNVYTLGFFHSLYSFDKKFAKALLTDIQNKGYYEVTDPEKLSFAFDDIAEDMLSENDNCPIIIVPGVMGSRLFDKNGMQWWNPEDEPLQIRAWSQKLDDNLSMSSKLYVHGNYDTQGKPINQALLSLNSREYGAADTYKVLLNSVIEEFNDTVSGSSRAVYFFSYDFRQDNTITARLLSEFIGDVLADNKEYSQVDIVAHSMGGLVSSKYVSDKGMNKIRRLITLSTPYEGAPKLIQSVLTRKVIDTLAIDLVLLHVGNLNTEIKASFPAIAQLVPNDTYFNSTLESGGRSNRFHYSYLSENRDNVTGYVPEITVEKFGMDINFYDSINTRIFKENLAKAKTFHNLVSNSSGNNILKDYDNTYFAVGINQSTITGLIYGEKNAGAKPKNVNIDSYLQRIQKGFPDIYNTKTEVSGDGTVPYHSLSMGGSLESLGKGRFAKFNTTHTGMVGYEENAENLFHLGNSQKAELIKWVINKLSKTEKYEVQTEELEKRKFIVIRIACPVEVRVKYKGEVLSSAINNDFNDRTSFGSIEFLGEKGDIKVLTLKDMGEGAYNIELTGTDIGSMDYDIRYYDEDENEIGIKEFTDIPVTKDMRGYASTAENDGIIHLDYNADGVYEHNLQAGNHASLMEELGIEKSGPLSKDENVEVPSSAADKQDINSNTLAQNESIVPTVSESIQSRENSEQYNEQNNEAVQRKIKDSGNYASIIHRNVSKRFPEFAKNVTYGWNLGTDGNWYYISAYDMDNKPIFKTGWHKEEAEGAWYYLSPKDGRMLVGEQVIDAKIYRFRENSTSIWQYNEKNKLWEYISGESRGKLYEEE